MPTALYYGISAYSTAKLIEKDPAIGIIKATTQLAESYVPSGAKILYQDGKSIYRAKSLWSTVTSYLLWTINQYALGIFIDQEWIMENR